MVNMSWARDLHSWVNILVVSSQLEEETAATTCFKVEFFRGVLVGRQRMDYEDWFRVWSLEDIMREPDIRSRSLEAGRRKPDCAKG